MNTDYITHFALPERTVFLLPVAGLLFFLGSVILGIIFLKAGGTEPQVDFV
jgi:hypothetical protein